MDKLCIFLVFALIYSETLSLSLRQRRQATSDNPNNDIDDRYGFDNLNQFPGQFPGQVPCQGINCPFQSLPQRQQPLFPQPQQPQFPQQQQPQLLQPQFPQTQQPQFSQTQQPQFPQQQQQQQSSTTVAPTASTTTSAAFRDCRRNCPVTAEYNPVCGSDNQTYDNPGALSCAQACGASITLLRSSRCPAVQAN